MQFTPEEMNQIVNKNGPAWDRLQEEKKNEAKTIFEGQLNEILLRAERRCKETGSDNFQIVSRALLDKNDRKLYEEVYKDIFNHLKNIGFKLNKVEICQVYEFGIEAMFYFGEPEKPKNTWKERFFNWTSGRTVYYGK